jgi:branched-chain amino acid transport system permease protein
MANIIQLLIYGIQLGSAYALLAIGYTMVYGIVGMINFVHGDFLMIGAFAAYFGLTLGAVYASSPLYVGCALLLACFVTGLVSVGVERIAYKPLRNKPRLSALITAIGVSLFIENLFRAINFIGPTPRGFPALIQNKVHFLGTISINNISLVVIVVTIMLMLGMDFLIRRTKIGWQMRAVSLDKDASALMGINVNRIISITFFIGAVLAAVTGILYSMMYPLIDIYMGAWMGTKAFVAAVFGGIGNIRGAMLGGIILGVIEVLASAVNSSIGYMTAFIVLVLVLILKPAGLLGQATVEKV